MSIPQRTSQEDIRMAQNDPLVRQALDLFGGQIVDVKRNRQVEADGLQSANGQADSPEDE